MFVLIWSCCKKKLVKLRFCLHGIPECGESECHLVLKQNDIVGECSDSGLYQRKRKSHTDNLVILEETGNTEI